MTGELLLVAVVLVATNVWVHVGSRRSHLWTGPLGALILLVAGGLAGLTWAQLGLDPGQLPQGLAVGLAGAALVAAAMAIGAVLPRTRGAFLDTRYDVAVRSAVGTALVTIPLATVVFEECAFRGVIWGLLERDHGPIVATVASSLLFGVWHVLPALDLARTSTAVSGLGTVSGRRRALAVLGTVVGTALAGIALAELRRRTGSLAAPFLVHWAANGCGVVVSSLLWAQQRAAGRSPARDEVRRDAAGESDDAHHRGRQC